MASLYRFKTLKEFKEENLMDYKGIYPRHFNNSGKMDYLLGMNISEKFNALCENKHAFYFDDWYIQSIHYKLKNQNYEIY